MSDINDRIGKLVAEKTGRCWHVFAPKLYECNNCNNGREQDKILWARRYDQDLNAVADARWVLLDTDEKRNAFTDALWKLVIAKEEWKERGMVYEDWFITNSSAEEQCLAILEAVGEKQ